jgi:lysozyme family protein
MWDKIISFVLKWEGGYVNHPADPGGETNRGITIAVYNKAKKDGLIASPTLKSLTKEDAMKIYAQRYYLCYGYDKLPFDVALILTDSTVNGGQGMAAFMVQYAGRISMDSLWGKQTQAALEANKDKPLFARELIKGRVEKCNRIIKARPASEAFRKGWYNRVRALAAEAGVPSPV